MSSPIKPNVGLHNDVHAFNKSHSNSSSKSTDRTETKQDHKVSTTQESVRVSQKKQLNASIIEASLQSHKSAGDQPLSLVLKTALQGINEALQASVEPDASITSVEDAYESGIDYSPEATAERIVSFSTQFLSAYREQNPEMSEEESLTSFMDVISGGIDQGFDEAKDILGGLNVLEGEVSTNIDKTYELVQEGLKLFVESMTKAEESAQEGS